MLAPDSAKLRDFTTSYRDHTLMKICLSHAGYRFVLLAAALIISACGTNFGLSDAGAPTITPQQFSEKVKSGAAILDVRSREEWADGHLQKARHMPIAEFEKQVAGLTGDPAAPIVVYCKSGSRASKAGHILQQHGFSAVSVLRPGGYAELKAAGLPIVEPQ